MFPSSYNLGILKKRMNRIILRESGPRPSTSFSPSNVWNVSQAIFGRKYIKNLINKKTGILISYLREVISFNGYRFAL